MATNDLDPDPDLAWRDREEKFGKVLKRSGVAITVTSLTDFLAFAVGGTTVTRRKFGYNGDDSHNNSLGPVL